MRLLIEIVVIASVLFALATYAAYLFYNWLEGSMKAWDYEVRGVENAWFVGSVEAPNCSKALDAAIDAVKVYGINKDQVVSATVEPADQPIKFGSQEIHKEVRLNA